MSSVYRSDFFTEPFGRNVHGGDIPRPADDNARNPRHIRRDPHPLQLPAGDVALGAASDEEVGRVLDGYGPGLSTINLDIRPCLAELLDRLVGNARAIVDIQFFKTFERFKLFHRSVGEFRTIVQLK